MEGIATRERTFASQLRLTWFGASKTVGADATSEAAEVFDADASRVTMSKRIIDTRGPHFRPLIRLKNHARKTWIRQTLPYVEKAKRLVPHGGVAGIADDIQLINERMEIAAMNAQDNRSEIIAEAESRLGRLFHPGDYPRDFRGLFGVTVTFPSVDPPSYLEQLHPEVYRAEQQRVAQGFRTAAQLAEAAFVEQMTDLLGHLREVLTCGEDGRPRVFRDSSVRNVQQFLRDFRQVSVESSPQLEALIAQTERLVGGERPQELRTSADLRAVVATELGVIDRELQAMTVPMRARRLARLEVSE